MQNTIHNATALMFILLLAIWLRIDCWEAEKNLKTTPRLDCALNALAIDEPLEYARLYLDGTMQMWVDAEDSFYL